MRVESTIDPSSGGVEVYAEITANPDAAPLRPGAFVEVVLPDRLHQQVVELPASALFHGDTVYAIEDGRLLPRPVELVADLGAQILVRGELDAGEPVVTSPSRRDRPGPQGRGRLVSAAAGEPAGGVGLVRLFARIRPRAISDGGHDPPRGWWRWPSSIASSSGLRHRRRPGHGRVARRDSAQDVEEAIVEAIEPELRFHRRRRAA